MDEKNNNKTPELKQTEGAVPEIILVDNEPIKAVMEGTPVPTAGAAVKKQSNKYTIITIVVVVIALLVVLYQLEKQDRIGTNVFGQMIAAIEANAPAATVNGQDIKVTDLESGIEQLSQAAVQQGFDPTDPEVQSEIRSQAVEMVINTALLEQAALENDVSVETEAIDVRITELAEAAGGKESLLERLAEFEIDEAQLRSDVEEELTIRALLDTVFTEADAVVTEQEIIEVYQNAAASNGGQPLPPLAEVSAQIEQQLLQNKEQEAIEAYVQSLRAAADITIN
ncbi:MAG: FKBP-type peptidyl-prolyl cis-trans isomerase (trigger factor) [Candidatus Paceibacteria bacterium]|jgi:FKBP-type peptidyl-prolyl cis-trans isomerase (trigger factor)